MNSGRSHDARKMFSLNVRLAQSIGLHRDPKYLELRSPMDECSTRQTLWWSMLHTDQQYSVTLGQALSISDIGDCPPPEPPAANEAMFGLYTFTQNFTILARQILSSREMTDLTKIDALTGKLVALWRTTPDVLRFTDSWMQPQKQLPESPLEVMSASKIHYMGLGGAARVLTSCRSLYRNSIFHYLAHAKASDGFADRHIKPYSILPINESRKD